MGFLDLTSPDPTDTDTPAAGNSNHVLKNDEEHDLSLQVLNRQTLDRPSIEVTDTNATVVQSPGLDTSALSPTTSHDSLVRGHSRDEQIPAYDFSSKWWHSFWVFFSLVAVCTLGLTLIINFGRYGDYMIESVQNFAVWIILGPMATITIVAAGFLTVDPETSLFIVCWTAVCCVNNYFLTMRIDVPGVPMWYFRPFMGISYLAALYTGLCLFMKFGWKRSSRVVQ